MDFGEEARRKGLSSPELRRVQSFKPSPNDPGQEWSKFAPTTNDISHSAQKHLLDVGCTYHGVRISDSCLTCPLSACRWDDTIPLMEFMKSQEKPIKGLHFFHRHDGPDKNKTAWVARVATELGVCEKTIWRRLRKGTLKFEL